MSRVKPVYRSVLHGVMIAALSLPGTMTADELRFDTVEHLNVEDGLAHSTVWSVHQDRRGFLWLGTGSALNRYDGYEFKAYRHNPKDPDSISGSEVMQIREDRQGDLWLVIRGRGLNRFFPAEERFERFEHDPDRPESLPDNRIRTLYEDRSGTLWIGAASGLIRRNPDDGAFTLFKHAPGNPDSLRAGVVLAVLEDRRGVLWVGTSTGLDHFDPEQGRFIHHSHDEEDPKAGVGSLYQDSSGDLWLGTQKGPCRLGKELGTVGGEGSLFGASFRCYWPTVGSQPATAFVEAFLEDRAGSLWVGTDHGLMRFIGPERKRFVHYQHDLDDVGSLSSDEIFDLHEDSSGILWIATRAGINKFDRRREQFSTMEPTEVGGRQVLSIVEDREGKLWVGTVDGGLTVHDRDSGNMVRYRADPNDSTSLSENTVMSMVVDHAGELWVGTQVGLDRFDPDDRSFVHYRNDPSDPTSFVGDGVFCLLETTDRDLWIGTIRQGLQRLDPGRKVFSSVRHDPENPRSLSSDDIYNLFEDRQGDVWVATYGGLNRLVGTDDSGSEIFERFLHDPADPASLSSNKVTSIYEDEMGTLWVGTSGHGLNRFDRERGTFRSLWRLDGLSDDKVVGLLGDGQGYLWISTASGLSRLDLNTETFRNFDADDGLHGNVFYIRPTYRSPRGELFFGGEGGLTSFFADQITRDLHPPQVQITDLRLLNEPVPLRRQDPSSPLEQSILDTEELVLTHRDKIIGLEFAGLHYAGPSKNRYAYQLEGFDDDWIETDARKRFAQYTNLKAGQYAFRVKASNKDGIWNEEGASLRIKVLPAPWRTWWAYSLYLLVGLAGLAFYARSQRTKLEQERALNVRLREADRLKNEFLANASHELRTPLHGVIGLAETLIARQDGTGASDSSEELELIVAGGRHLDHLVGRLLDFSQLRRGQLDVDIRPVDVEPVVEAVFELMRSGKGETEVTLVNEIPSDLPRAQADEDRFRQILLSLVANALKFTEKGRVTVHAEATGTTVRIRVTDSGSGISAEHLEVVFEPFRQADASEVRRHGGLGLGLSISRDLAELQGGTLEARSVEGEGSVFELCLPVAEPSEILERAPDTVGSADPGPVQVPVENESRARVLVVDDEPLNRLILVNQLEDEGYEAVEAEDGEQALSLVEEATPDLILLDVMMPRMSGFEVCRTLRRRFDRNELPILFVSAKTRQQDVDEGLEVGGNDYLPKPTTREDLLERIEAQLP